ncbi:MAG: DUF1579 domain-containing protein, partial [Pseudomonadota bacterium]|nr:DUF1579 domain-containing protein [Pseudomonadota bacterium]
DFVQTERVGTFLDGSVRLIEGRAYLPDGSVAINVLAVVSHDAQSGNFTVTSWAMGQRFTFPLRATADGFVSEVPAEAGAIIRYTATFRDGVWREIGEHIAGDAAPVQVFEMNLRRVGDTAWPAADPVPPR